MASHDPACTCGSCRAPLDPEAFDFRFLLPDRLLTAPDGQQPPSWAWRRPMLRANGFGDFVRCLLPVRLAGGVRLGLGTWLEVSPDDYERAAQVWRTPEYASLALEGTLANAIQPWGEALLDGRVRVEVRDPEQIPYVVGGDNPVVTGILETESDPDEVLGTFGEPLPVAIRQRLTDNWSISRGVGFTSDFVDQSIRMGAPGRTVILNCFQPPPEEPLERVLASLTRNAPAPEGTAQENTADEARYALWLKAGEQHELYGFIARPGSVLTVTCIHDDPDDHGWALDVWRSARYHV